MSTIGQQMISIDEEWRKFCLINNLHQSNRQSLNVEDESEILFRQLNDQILAQIDRHIALRNSCNKYFDGKIAKIIEQSELEFGEGEIYPTLQELIENHHQIRSDYEKLKNEMEEIIKKRKQLSDDYKKLDVEINLLRSKRDHLIQIIDDEDNLIKSRSSKICFRTNKNALVAMLFNNGQLKNFVIDDKENSTKEDIWNCLNEKILI
ncbi:hypothetical protein SSS_00176 [Sarcoptes scabiei]|uniref:Uncharacterized protein n=1 Tax=Sarcoptes scabiei TaxID=52283 RepID=A0A834VAS0_SARSC|nr:hypothetical protein SSS_00176 [Sarcoptes scabiei]